MGSTESSQLGHRQILEVLAGLMLGMFLAALDQTIVASAIRTIGDDLHGLSMQAWVTTAYLITATISTPLYGKLSDIYGRKRFFLAAITIFVLGSAACSFATSMYVLAGCRAVQGLGAGGLFSLALAIIADVVPARDRPRYQGYFLAVFGMSSVLGPVIGGFFAGADQILGIAGWRWVFLVNVPVGVVALFVVARRLRLPHRRRDHRIDWWGAATICVCLVPLLTVAEQGRAWGWGDRRSLICYAIAAFGLALFLLSEAIMGEEALIPLRFFGNPTFALTSAGGFVIGMGMFGGLALLPLYLQIVRGATPTESGLQLLPLTAGIVLGSLISGRLISRTGRYKPYPIAGAILMIAGLLMLASLGVDTPFGRTGMFMGIFGFGLGLVLQPITLAVQNAMAPSEIGVATSSATFFRQMGATAGTAIFLSILFGTVGDRIGAAYRDAHVLSDPAVTADPANRPLLAALHGGGVSSSSLDDTSFLDHVSPALARPFQSGFSTAMDHIFLMAAVVLLVAWVLFLFLPQIPLRAQSAMAARESATPPTAARTSAPAPVSVPAHPGAAPAPTPVPAALAHPAAPEAEPAPAHPFAATGTATTTGRARAHAAPASTHAEPAVIESAALVAAVTPDAIRPSAQPASVSTSGESVSKEEVRPVVSGRVDGPDGLPLDGATVTVAEFAGGQVAHTVTGGDGEFRLPLPAGGAFLLICAADDHQPAAVLVNAGVGEIRRVLSLAGAGRIEGRITDRQNRPVGGATVTLTDLAGTVVATATTGADGQYRLAGLDQADYMLTATAEHARPATRIISPGRSRQADLMLTIGTTLSGSVRAARSGRPVPEASVVAVGADGEVAGSTTTDRNGRYELRDLPPGTYTVAASGHAPVATRVELSGEHTDHDILLGAPVVVTGSPA
ncbi:MFS transporter [Paractinoplanes globisporus]|uniref:MFS transporter n=1 Tax=Paractinoplanes globisporus TaxID=113565 RepID=A0ABW6WM39_9ACTN|nr:MFS transporter [Actinoplanes globisporus]